MSLLPGKHICSCGNLVRTPGDCQRVAGSNGCGFNLCCFVCGETLEYPAETSIQWRDGATIRRETYADGTVVTRTIIDTVEVTGGQE